MTSGRMRPSDCDHGFLFDEVAILQHAREFDHAAQLNLTPASAHMRSTQRSNQISSFGLQLHLRSGQRLHLFAQLGISAGARLFHFANLAINFFQRLAQRSDQFRRSLFALSSRSPLAVC